MNILIDTNIVIDVLISISREPWSKSVKNMANNIVVKKVWYGMYCSPQSKRLWGRYYEDIFTGRLYSIYGAGRIEELGIFDNVFML